MPNITNVEITKVRIFAVWQTFHTSYRTSNSIYAYLRRVYTRPDLPDRLCGFGTAREKQRRKVAKCRTLEQQLYVSNATTN